MQLEYKSMQKTSIGQPRSSSFSVTTSMAVAIGYETLSKRTIPMESVFSGMGDLHDKIRPMPVTVCANSLEVIQFYLFVITLN